MKGTLLRGGGRILIPGRKSYNYVINISLREAGRGINNMKSLIISGARGVDEHIRAERCSLLAQPTPGVHPLQTLGGNE